MRSLTTGILAAVVLSMANGCADLYPSCPALAKWCDVVEWVKTDCEISCGVCAVATLAPQYLTTVFDPWSTCTKTCGEGTQYMTNSFGNKEYRACSTQPCPQASCIGQVRRRGIPHACCADMSIGATCGVQDIGGRVVGGMATFIARHPWTALIKTDNTVFCAGVIISNMWLLSAAHCFRNTTSRVNYVYTNWKIYVGIDDASQTSSLHFIQPHKVKDINTVVIHRDHYHPTSDIALIQVKSQFSWTNEIKPVCLPGGEVTPKDTTCFIVGWGISNVGYRTLTNILQEAAILNYDLDICRNAYKGTTAEQFLARESRLLCAGNLDRLIDACGGDSGGPLVCQRCSSCTYYVAGIVSFGSGTCNQKHKPGIYTKVVDYEDWISQTIFTPKTYATQCSSTVGP